MCKKSIFGPAFLLMVFILFIGGCASQTASSIVRPVDLNPKVASGQFTQKVNAFEIIFDATHSMNESYKSGTKLSQEKPLVALFNDTIPNLNLVSAGRAFGQFTAFGDPTSSLLFGPGSHSKSIIPQAIAPITFGRGFSPLDAALDGATSDLKSQSGQLAVIAFSDGEDMDKYAPVAAAQRMKSAYGDRICIYTVHLGDSVAGGKVMQQVADAGRCGFMVQGNNLSSPQAMADFVEKIFLKTAVAERPVFTPAPKPEVKKEPVPEMKEEPKPEVKELKPQAQEAPKVAVKEPVTIQLNIEFATAKSNIQKKYHDEVKRVADFMTKYPETKAVIEGHTDNVGKEAYNMKLSKDRADSVKKYLTEKFKIDSSRLEAVGYGPNKPIASNETKEGKQKNRRVTAVFSNVP